MVTMPCWLLTDYAGGSLLAGHAWRQWGRGVTHTEPGAAIVGYSADSPHLPYLLDPIHDRIGSAGRLWLSEVPSPQHLDSNRVQAATWTTWDEWEKPSWVGGDLDVRVRLRLALMAAAELHTVPAARLRVRNLPLVDLGAAAIRMEKVCSDAADLMGRVPQAISMAAQAVRLAAWRELGKPAVEDQPARRYPLHAWYAAMAAACACEDLSHLADAAVYQECRQAMPMHAAAVAIA